MGLTYAKSFLHARILSKDELMILEKSAQKAKALQKLDLANIYKNPEHCLKQADLIVLAVKPQDADLLFDTIRPYVDDQQVYLSIMAGINIESIKKHIPCKKIIRAMPNLAAQIGMGMTVYTSTDDVTRIELVLVQNLLNTTGKAFFVSDEQMIDAATAISGSGPAYVFYYMQSIIEAAKKMGFSHAESELLTWQTFKGAIELFHKNDLTCSEWIERVASRGGTTEAALNAYEENGLRKSIMEGSFAAFNRAQQLGNA